MLGGDLLMKRIKAACIEQTIHFMLKNDLGHALAVRTLKSEVERYKVTMDQAKINYKIVEEAAQPDDSIIIKIKKQYNGYDCGDYLA